MGLTTSEHTWLLTVLGVLLIAGYIRNYRSSKHRNLTGTLEIERTARSFSYEIGAITVYNTKAFGIQVKLPTELPNILVDSHTNDHYGQSMVFEADISQRLQLEGDFYKNFSVYAPKGYERTALQFLPPDVMELLVQNSRAFDLELYGHTLNLYSYTDPRTDSKLADDLRTVASAVLSKSEGFMRSWDDNPDADRALLFLRGRDIQMTKIGRWQVAPWLANLMWYAVAAIFMYVIIYS